MPQASAGFWVNNILDRFAWELLRVLQDNLTQAIFVRDRLDTQILLLLSKKLYVDRLLYRDLNVAREDYLHRIDIETADGKRTHEIIHDQAIEYLYQVLGRRLTLAQNLLHRPTNMHVAFEALCRYGPEEHGWRDASIKRGSDRRAQSATTGSIAVVAEQLAHQRAALGSRFGEISKRRRLEHGAYYLTVADHAIEMPEEMSLFDVINALPKPLALGLSQDRTIQNVFNRLIKSLNERYMLLRACGLEPAAWLHREQPSIANLRGMKHLRREANDLLGSGESPDTSSAFRRAFLQLKGARQKFAGFRAFDEFATNEIGRTMLNQPMLSLEQDEESETGQSLSIEEASLRCAGAEALEDAALAGIDFSRQVSALVETRPDLFDPVMASVFHESFGLGQPLGDAVSGAHLRELLDADPRYACLDDNGIVQALHQRSQEIIEKGIRECP